MGLVKENTISLLKEKRLPIQVPSELMGSSHFVKSINTLTSVIVPESVKVKSVELLEPSTINTGENVFDSDTRLA